MAFIHPGQKALDKVTAYDYSIYGGLEGEVTMISPDTLQDEVKGMFTTTAFISAPTVTI